MAQNFVETSLNIQETKWMEYEDRVMKNFVQCS